MKKGILFDLDGTLWDVGEAMAAVWTEALGGFNCALREVTPEMICSVMGMTEEQIVAKFCPDLTEKEGRALLAKCAELQGEHLAREAILFSGLGDTLRALSDEYTLAVVSNCGANYLEYFLLYPEVAGLFTDYEYRRTGLCKAENIRLVASRNSLDAVLYVGDTLWDKQAADAAGVPFLHAAYGFGEVPEGTPAIRDIRDLPDAVKELI